MNIFQMFTLFDEGEIDLDDLAKLIKETVDIHECSWKDYSSGHRGGYLFTMGKAAQMACENQKVKEPVFDRIQELVIDLIENHYEEAFYFCEKQLARDTFGRRIPEKKPAPKKPEAFTCSFQAHEQHEPQAGIHFHGDKVAIAIESGDPGGTREEFQEFMAKALSDWYQVKVTVIDKEKP